MTFVVEKDPGLIPQILSQILDSSVNGITLVDPDQEDMPLVYANRQFELITGYSQQEILGGNCRFLQGSDRDQEGRFAMRRAIEKKPAGRSDNSQLSEGWNAIFQPFDAHPLVRWRWGAYLLSRRPV